MLSNLILGGLIDTHCHLNFEAYTGNVEKTIDHAKSAGINTFVVPGTDVATSKKAIALAGQYPNVHAAVGIHPHHFYKDRSYEPDIADIAALLQNPYVVAVGEVGLDKHAYEASKYGTYVWSDEYMDRQKKYLKKQIGFAVNHRKSLIIHNREAGNELMKILDESWDAHLRNRSVIHCCEADEALLAFATAKQIYLGVDGDITWSKKKQRFIETVPLDRLVLETDSPYLTPDPAREKQKFPNEPANLVYIRDMVASIKHITPEEVEKQTSENARALFNI